MNSRPVARLVLALMAALLAAACGGSEPPARQTPAETPLASRNCLVETADTAQAICIALNTVERVGGFRSTPEAVSRRGDTLCVHTMAASGPAVLDGEGAVEVLHGRVINAEVTDSTGCPIPHRRIDP
jgi:hypothetical protein